MQGPPHFGLPGEGVHELMQLHRDLDMGQRLAAFVEQFEIGDEPERVGHGDHAGLDLDPVPGHARRLLCGRVSPERLAGARRLLVAETEHAGAQVLEVQLRRATGLPQ